MPLSIYLRRNRCLSQRFTLAADPFPAHMLLHGEHAQRVIQLLADVLADPLELAAAGALGVIWFVINHGARKLRRQRNTLGLLAWRSRRIQLFLPILSTCCPRESTWDSSCAARACSWSEDIWSRLGDEVMPRILPEQAVRGDRPMG